MNIINCHYRNLSTCFGTDWTSAFTKPLVSSSPPQRCWCGGLKLCLSPSIIVHLSQWLFIQNRLCHSLSNASAFLIKHGPSPADPLGKFLWLDLDPVSIGSDSLFFSVTSSFVALVLHFTSPLHSSGLSVRYRPFVWTQQLCKQLQYKLCGMFSSSSLSFTRGMHKLQTQGALFPIFKSHENAPSWSLHPVFFGFFLSCVTGMLE